MGQPAIWRIMFPAPFSPAYNDALEHPASDSLTRQEPASMLAACNRFRFP
jgi:hypothetical protein